MDDRVAPELEKGRGCYARRAWSEAFDALTAADCRGGLDAEDLERLATSAYLTGRDEHYLDALERAYRCYKRSGVRLRAVRCAFWIGMRLLLRGERGRATGWFARAGRLLDGDDAECPERGYLLVPITEEHLGEGRCRAGYSTAFSAAEIGARFGDEDLLTIALHQQGKALLQEGRIARGLALLDEAMVAVVAGNLSPIVTGLVYCSVIDACRSVYALERVREWTAALSQWCDLQTQMVAFSGTCLVHRAEIMHLTGAWSESLAAARLACERCTAVANRRAAGAGFYQEGEVYRVRGEFARAEESYRNASRLSVEPQPGLALLRLAQGRTQAAAAAMRRVVAVTGDVFERTALLPAHVEIMLAAGDAAAAETACRELEDIAATFAADALSALAAQARGAVELREGKPGVALGALRRAGELWQRVDAPHPAARTRVLAGLACRALGDDDGAQLELDAARTTFERLEATPDLASLDSIGGRNREQSDRGLTRRELEVLRLLATGKTNREIATELFVSERTVDRHVSNILGKLSVPSRSAATAYAYRHRLV